MLPTAFTERMQRLLGEEYTDFYRAMTEEPPRAGLRVNPLKMERARFLQNPPFPVEPIPYTPDGFYHAEEKIGHHPYHHAGILYSQDPGAMSTLAAAPSMRCARVSILSSRKMPMRILSPRIQKVKMPPAQQKI